MTGRRPVFAVDLDGTLGHAEPVDGGLPIRGRTTASFLDPAALDRLAALSRRIDLVVATGRSASTVADFKRHFAAAGVRVAGWILEHGAVVADRPDWEEKVLAGIDLSGVWDGIEAIISAEGLPIEVDYYRADRRATVVLSGKGPVLAEYLIDRAAPVLGNRFRSLVGKRKITLIPARATKEAAFAQAFGDTRELSFAAGDTADDLGLLRETGYPLTLTGAAEPVRRYVANRGGFVASGGGHAGTIAIIDEIAARLDRSAPGPPTPGPRLPIEETDHFRPSRQVYRDRVWAESPLPTGRPDPARLDRMAARLAAGRGRIIEVRMRDWGGEAKPLRALLSALVPRLPHARWRLVFRPERRGVENLTGMDRITDRLPAFARLPDGSPRFSAPGVPSSPPDSGPADVSLWLYDHVDDLYPWYERTVGRLVIRHPARSRTWLVNPSFLKIAGALMIDPPEAQATAPQGMIAANLVDETDIRVAAEGFARLRDRLAGLIVAPRVITNPDRNRRIDRALREIGETPVPLTKARRDGRRPRVLVVDTYGDLARLYAGGAITYLGGGFDPRKRGFDPAESLAAGVPVVTGPLCDYNRVAVKGLDGTGWITLIEDADSAPDRFVEAAERLLARPPSPADLETFFNDRRLDPERVAAEILAGLSGDRNEWNGLDHHFGHTAFRPNPPSPPSLKGRGE